MRVLLFAYEFPPILSAQSLRWYYLTRELADIGWEIDILTPKIADLWGFTPALREGIRVYRSFPGPFVGVSGAIARWMRGPNRSEGAAPATRVEQAYRGIRWTLDRVLFPDLRTEWMPFAWRTARPLLQQRRYDWIASSHEPGVDLLLGLRARQRSHLPWLVDLADPLLAPYAPGWRRPLDRALERRVCRSADVILVTAERARHTLAARHQAAPDRFVLVTQGFDHRWRPPQGDDFISAPAGKFLLVYTGTFYRRLRDPGVLFDALRALTQIHAVFIGDMGPWMAALDDCGQRIRMLGKRDHSECKQWQARATVLLNVGNVVDDQVPGKVYEYLGANRPILHIANSPGDPVGRFLVGLGRGLDVPAEGEPVMAALRDLYALWQRGRLDGAFNLSSDVVTGFSWASQARRVHSAVTAFPSRNVAS